MTTISEKTGIDFSTVSTWGKENDRTFAVPDIFDAQISADAIGASPAWFAFGAGPSDLIAAKKGFELAEQFATVPGLAHVAEAYSKAGPEDQKMMQQLAGKFTPAPAIDIKPASAAAPAPPASHPHTASPEHLDAEQAEALLRWMLSQVKTMPKERPLTIALRKIATQLTYDAACAGLAKNLGQALAARGSPKKAAPTSKSRSQPATRHK